MPPRVSFTREMVLDCAFDIVCREGLGALSARRVAEGLECSTRPVYEHFESMKALEEAVVRKARLHALDYFVRAGENSGSPFLDLGMRYFRFSREERELFKLLYMEGRMGDTLDAMGKHLFPLLDHMRKDPRLAGLDEDSLKRVGTASWIYTHGLVALVYAAQPENAEYLVLTHLRRMGPMLVGWEREGRGGQDRE